VSNPTTLVEQFDSSPGEFTVSGPERYDDGLWLEEGTTNEATNPSIESGITDWGTNASGTTRTQSATGVVDGANAIEVVNDGTVGAQGLWNSNGPATVQNDVWTLSFYGQGAVGAEVIRPGISQRSGANANLGEVFGANKTLTTSPARYDAALTMTNASVAEANIKLLGPAATTAATWYLDAIQLEKKPYATSFVDGTRAASSASLSPAGILSPTTGALAFRLTPTIETGLEEIWGECGTKGTGTDHMQWGRDATKHPFVEWSSNDSAYTRVTLPGTVEAGDEHFYSIEWSTGDNYLGIYRDREEYEYGVPSAPSGSFGAGDITLKATAGGVIYRNFLAADRPLTDAERFILFSVDTWTMDTIGPGYETSGGWGSPTGHGGSDGGASWGMQNLSVIAHPDDDRVRR